MKVKAVVKGEMVDSMVEFGLPSARISKLRAAAVPFVRLRLSRSARISLAKYIDGSGDSTIPRSGQIWGTEMRIPPHYFSKYQIDYGPISDIHSDLNCRLPLDNCIFLANRIF